MAGGGGALVPLLCSLSAPKARGGEAPSPHALALLLGWVRAPFLRGNKARSLSQPVAPPRTNFTRVDLLLIMF